MTAFRDELLARFRWIDGHADVLGLFAEPGVLARAGEALADPFRAAGVTRVAGVEARAFVLGTAVALELGAGFVAVRKRGAVHPGPKAARRTGPDWRARETTLQVQRAALSPRDRVLLVDDWAETGSQALAARELVEECGADYAGLSLLVDQLAGDVRERLEPVAAVAAYGDLPWPD